MPFARRFFEVMKIVNLQDNTGKKYSSPKIAKFGQVRELTTGGSGNPGEMGDGTMGDLKKMS
jgi:hypothetical protein